MWFIAAVVIGVLIGVFADWLWVPVWAGFVLYLADTKAKAERELRRDRRRRVW